MLAKITQNWVPIKFIGLILITIFFIFFGTHPLRDWSLNADQEFTLAYNATLINAGINQDYYDHPGFFTIQLIALLLKFSSILGFTSIQTIGDLNQYTPLFQGFDQITVVARFLAASSVAVILICWFLISRKILKNDLLALGVTGCVFLSESLMLHFSQLRNEPISFLLFIVSIFLLIKLNFSNDYRKKLFLFFGVILFFFLAALNKTQIIFYAPIYYFCAICCLGKTKTENNTPYENLTQVLLTLLAIAICLFFAYRNAIPPSNYFNVAFLISIYLTIFIYWRVAGGNLSIQILVFNILFIFAFLLIQFSLKSIGANVGELLKQIQSPLVMLMFANSKVQDTFSKNIPVYALDVRTIYNFILSPILNVLSNLNSQSFFFWTNTLLYIFLKKRFNRHENLSITALLLGFFVITIISNTRYLAPQYVLYSECLLILIFILLISKLDNLRFQWLIVLLLTIGIFYSGFSNFWKGLNQTSNQYKLLCDPKNDYMRWWHGKLDYQKFISECKANGF